MSGTLPLSSLVQPSREREFPLYHYDKKDRGGMDRAPTLPHSQLSSAQRPSQLPSTMKRQIFPSPLAPSHHGNSRRSPWYHNRQAPGPVRLEIGDMGAKNLETRRCLKGINSMVRGNAAPGTLSTNPLIPRTCLRTQQISHSRVVAPYRGDINTPVKVDGPAPGRLPSTQSHHPLPFHASSGVSGSVCQPITLSATASRYPAQPNVKILY